jgi:thiosulfate/3-mercaptopyruvate sulfurtransferase
MAYANIVDVNWVRNRLNNDSSKLVLLDVRYNPKDPNYGRAAYDKAHLPGAFFIDFKADLTDPPQEHGGRSPLPDPERLVALFGGLGIDSSVTIVAYEDGNGPAASRLWWLLRYLGHERTYVLDGGYAAWQEAGQPVTAAVAEPSPRKFVPAPRSDWLADVETVRTASSGTRPAILVDAREPSQYLGLTAPYDPVPGRIPGARSYFWQELLTADGRWRSPEELQRHFAGIASDSEVIVYCGSGISATPDVLALREAGFPNVRLYAGSWSDWISYPDNPIAFGEEERA